MSPAGLYVHVPFCARKCLYCDFYSVAPGCEAAGDYEGYVTAVLAEARRGAPDWAAECFDTLYLGGGTPSCLPAAPLGRLIAVLRRPGLFTWDAALEVTIEANPDDADAAWLEALHASGVNRLSLGIQSFDDEALAWLGRRHDAAGARQAIDAARQAGFANLSVDLIYGLPGQTLAAWRQTLKAALAYDPEHLSCYQLTVEERTPLGRQHALKPLPLPDEEASRAFFVATAEDLDDAGYEHYEISSFARRSSAGPSLRSRHNQKYWQHTPYLGLGPSAHSFRGERRWWNPRDRLAWQGALAAGGESSAQSETLSADQLTLERLMLGLRTADGVPIAVVTALAGGAATLDELIAEGLLARRGDHVAPTRRGLLIADQLPLRFEL